MTRGRSRMRESCMYGSVRGAPSNGRPYRDQNLPPRHNLSDAVIILRLRELVGSPGMRSALERGSDNGVRTLPLADLPQPLRGLRVLCFGARRSLLLVKEVYPAHILNVRRSSKP